MSTCAEGKIKQYSRYGRKDPKGAKTIEPLSGAHGPIITSRITSKWQMSSVWGSGELPRGKWGQTPFSVTQENGVCPHFPHASIHLTFDILTTLTDSSPKGGHLL